MYTGYLLSETSRSMLMSKYPPKYPDVLGHHITEEFGVRDPENTPKQPEKVEVVGYIDNGKNVEGFLVSVDGRIDRPNGGKYHITWSIDRSDGAKPVHTNDYVDDALMLDHPIEIQVESKFFDR